LLRKDFNNLEQKGWGHELPDRRGEKRKKEKGASFLIPKGGLSFTASGGNEGEEIGLNED